MSVIGFISAALYILTSLTILLPNLRFSRFCDTQALSAAALISHGAYTWMRSNSDNGIDLSLFAASNLVAITLALMAIIISYRQPLQKLTVPILLLAAFNIIASGYFNDKPNVIPLTVATHVVPSLLAYSLFSFAAAHACLLWFQHHALKTQQLNKLINTLPPLDALESALFIMVGGGFILLTIGILSGIVYIDDFWHQRLAHKTFFSFLSWLIFGVLLTGRRIWHWRGSDAISWTICGYGLLLIGYFGSKFVVEYLL